jgi:predicted GNAT superfamily acetyltransferase
MNSRKRKKPADAKDPWRPPGNANLLIGASKPANREIGAPTDGISFRRCHSIEEFEACVQVERLVWKSQDIDVVPIPLFVVAAETGGQVLAAYDGPSVVGFTLAIAGWRAGKPFLHSHMTAVLDTYRDRSIGRRLKFFQRDDAIARGISLVEWTFDPFIMKNAYFNFMLLGAIARRFLPNAYGITTSPLNGLLPTDRLIAEWHLLSDRVSSVLAGKPPTTAITRKSVRIAIPSNFEVMRSTDPSCAIQWQADVRARFAKYLVLGYTATAVRPTKAGMEYILEPGSRL